MNERDRVKLRDMRDTILKARGFIAGRTRADLEVDDMLAFAVVRAVEIVGEAAAQISQTTRDLYPHIPWRNMIGMRNRIIHDYGNVDNTIVWDVVTRNFDDLLAMLDTILASEDE